MSVIEVEPGFKFHKLLAENLEPLKKRVLNKDRDVCILITGKEGFGKSVLAQQVAYFFDRSFNIDRLTFGLPEFKKACLEAQPGQAVQGDELLDIFAGRAATSKQNKEMMRLLAKLRQQRLFILLVCPSVFEVDRYAVLHRADLLLHCFSAPGDRIGYFNFYGSEALKRLYILGKKFMDYKVVKPDFQGTFSDTYTVDEKKYREKKGKDLISEGLGEKPSKRQQWLEEKFIAAIKNCHNRKMSGRAIARLFTMDQSTMRTWFLKAGIEPQVGFEGELTENDNLLLRNAVEDKEAPPPAQTNSL